MISKKKLTALAVASLFVTPVMAGTSNNVWKNEISNQGSMTVGDEDFKKAAENTDPDRLKKVVLRLNKESEDTINAGLIDLTLTNKDGYKLKKVTFHENFFLNPKSRTGWLYNQPVPYFLRVAAR